MPGLRLTALLGLLLLALAACTTTVVLGASDPRTHPDGAAGVPCGVVDCDPGKICCDAACGVCAALGGCPPTPRTCADASVPCGPDAVALTGSAACTRFVWNGVDCAAAAGCDCAGDCSLPQASYVDCMRLHAACWSPACGPGQLCPDGFFCARTSCDPSGAGACTPTPTSCAGIPHTASCACDGIAYVTECDAARAHQTLAGSPGCACRAPAVTLAPGCATSLGWAWTGASCVEQIGCACSGECDRIEPDRASCLARYEAACSTVFPCGDLAACERGVEYCLTGVTGGACAPAPPACAGASSCACLAAAGVAEATLCSEDGAGGVFVALP